MGIYGQDWASYQDDRPDTGGLAFVFVKITEGLGYTNPKWVGQRDHAKANGLVWGGYHYPHMANPVRAEADHFLAQVAWKPGDLIVLDWEGYDTANRAVPHAAQRAYKDEWLRYVKSRMPHNPVGMYCNTDYWRNVDTSGAYGDFLWIATAGRAAGDPGVNAPWLFHQYSDRPVDSDYCHLAGVDALRTWALGFATPPVPSLEDPMAAFSEDDIRRFIREEVSSIPVRDMVAFATIWWLDKAVRGTVPPTAAGGPWASLIPQVHQALAQLPPEALAQLQAAVTAAVKAAAPPTAPTPPTT